MFGGSTSPPAQKKATSTSTTSSTRDVLRAVSERITPEREKRDCSPSKPAGRGSNGKRNDASEKKRRSNSANKATALLSSAKNSLQLSSLRDSLRDSLSPSQSSFRVLSTMDSALAVPQGALNNSAGESLPTPRSSFRVGVTEDRNKKCRRTMEDTHAYLYHFLGTPLPPQQNESAGSTAEATQVIETDNGYFAIFDGHAGTFAAEWCGKKLHLILEDIMRKNPDAPVPELLDQAFTSADQQLEKLPVSNSGCTAITAVLRWEDRAGPNSTAEGAGSNEPVQDKTISEDPPEETLNPTNLASPGPGETSASRSRVLYTANVGDARIILCRNRKALRLSYDHKGSDENEGRRITNAGGLILNNRVNGVLAVTRALGDAYMKDLVTGHPYTTETVILPEEDEFIILACDGLWDVCSDQEAVDLIYDIQDPQEASKCLVDHALSRFSTDNLSIMVVRLNWKNPQDATKGSTAAPSASVASFSSSAKTQPVSETDRIVHKAAKKIEEAGDWDAEQESHVAAVVSGASKEDSSRDSPPDEKQDIPHLSNPPPPKHQSNPE